MSDLPAAAGVFLGGGVGAVTRWALTRTLDPWDDAAGFPWVTFGINAVGSAAFGALVVVARERPAFWLLSGVGLCGGFTTFSTFSGELLRLVDAGRIIAALCYACASVVAGFLSVLAAARLAAAAATP